jgi:LCP family protein required for cell wall assembly
MGVDAAPDRQAALTDTLIVVSLDTKAKTVSMVSIPRDMVNVPLGNGNTYGPKINSLLGYANSHPDEFPKGGTQAVEDAVGALLGIPIQYFATVDLGGFSRVVNAVGGVDILVARPLSDPSYSGFGIRGGWSITAGPHHLDGANALAYARIRKAPGESDFTRADRQQQILVAIRDQAVKSSLLLSLPSLLDALSRTIRTDVPLSILPDLAALADEIGGGQTTRVVIQPPLVSYDENQYGSVLIPDLKQIRQVAKLLFPPVGTPPKPWPTPTPTPAPPSPKPSP